MFMIEPLRTAVLNAKCADDLDADSDDEVRIMNYSSMNIHICFSFVLSQNRHQLVNNRNLLANII